jgi:hypothetical protein
MNTNFNKKLKFFKLVKREHLAIICEAARYIPTQIVTFPVQVCMYVCKLTNFISLCIFIKITEAQKF